MLKKWMLLILTAALLLSGCTAAPDNTSGNLAVNPTVDDLFTRPISTLPTGTPSHNATWPTDTTEPTTPPYTHIDGGASFGPAEGYLFDDVGHYFPYNGGEMCMKFMLSASGTMVQYFTEKGFGVILLVDGQAQPYRLDKDGDLSYFHTIYPNFDPVTNDYYFDVYFTPVSGNKGEMVEFYASNFAWPNWQSSDPITGVKYTHGCCFSGSRLKMNEDPPAADKPAVTERMQSVDIRYEDVLKEEIQGWSDSDLIKRCAFECYVNGLPYNDKNRYYNISEGDTVELRFEVWGTPFVKYGLMFYVDNQPISTEQEIFFDVKNGQKTVITVMLDVRDFDGEWALYAALIPRNCRSTDVPTNAFIDYTGTFFLMEKTEPEK